MVARPHPQTPASRAQKVALAAAALLCCWTLYADPVARARAVSALHPLISAVVGSPPPITFAATRARRTEIDGRTILYVEGSLWNAGQRTLKTPTLKVTLIGDDGRPLYAWTTKPARAELPASQGAAFQARLLSPPERFKRIEVSLAQGSS
ncbi:MAG TPA: FxLYD domain-containing protein [Roseiarcus sp.]|nr:FxLYD domain-containing protein [Roseiarcus sp.]